MPLRIKPPAQTRVYAAMQTFFAGATSVDAGSLDAYARHHHACDVHIASYFRLLCRLGRGSVAERVARQVRTHRAELMLRAQRPLIFSLHWVDLFFCVAGIAHAAQAYGAELLVVRRPKAMRFDTASILALAERSRLPVSFVAPGDAHTLPRIAAHLDKNWPVLVLIDLWAAYGPTLPTATLPDGGRVLNLCVNPFLLARRMRASIFTAAAHGSVAGDGLDIHFKYHPFDGASNPAMMTDVSIELFGAVGPGRGLWLSWLAYPFLLSTDC